MALLVLDPGMLSLVEDPGRFGFGALGVSAAGAADPVSLRVGNRLVGNPDDAAALEMTLVGATLQTDARAVIAVCGSDFGASIDMWTAVALRAGDVVRLGPTHDGARCTLCVRGGIDVPRVLGSASTHLASGIGGVSGRALRAGDRVPTGPDPGAPLRRLRVPARVLRDVILRRALRVTPGPQARWFGPEALATLAANRFTVTEEADRTGIRLRGPKLARQSGGEMLTEGVGVGAVQVPDGGEPIILFVDQQTTGGYPKIANVIAADCAALGQIRPRMEVTFEWTSLDEARRIFAAQEALLADALEDA